MSQLVTSQEMKQRFTPQQIQFMNLLQMSGGDLGRKIQKELEENPALEQKEGVEEDSVSRQDAVSGKKEDERKEFYPTEKGGGYPIQEKDLLTMTPSWRDRLEEQVRLLYLDEKQQKIARYLIGTLSEEGYLVTPSSIIAAELSLANSRMRVTVDEVEVVIPHVQELDPPGIGARDLQESLLIQIRRRKSSIVTDMASQMIRHFFLPFSKRQYGVIMEKMRINAALLKEVLAEVRQLNAQPVTTSSQEVDTKRLEADFFIHKKGSDLQVTIPKSGAATLRIRDTYQLLCQDYKKARDKAHKQAVAFIGDRIQRAKWFMEAIEQRHRTLLKVMNTLVDMQRPFFLAEEVSNLRPLTLRDIADRIQMDVSTVSRAISGKSLQTEHTIHPLKFFFSEGIPTRDGKMVSSRWVKKVLFDIIATEKPEEPYTDDALVSLLAAKDFQIARRTVAKYRDQWGIASYRLRRDLSDTETEEDEEKQFFRGVGKVPHEEEADTKKDI